MTRLGLVSDSAKLTLTGLENTPVAKTRGSVTLKISLPNSDRGITDKFYVVKGITRNLPILPVDEPTRRAFQTLPLADPTYHTPGVVDSLFGNGIWLKLIEPDIIRGCNELSIAQRTKLGYVIFQGMDTSQLRPSKNKKTLIALTTTAKQVDVVKELSQIMQQFWEIEDFPKIKHLTDEEVECEDFFNKTHYRMSDGHYVVRLPFNKKLKLLGSSKEIALRQFYSVERRMLRNEAFRSDYITFMKNHEECKYMTKIGMDDGLGYYTPHHGVYSSSKFRVVFNASCKTTTGISLNECQMVGQKLQDDLANIVMRFRTRKVALTADIKQMYCRIEVDHNDKKYQKIIWRKTPKEPVQVYLLNVVVYGQASAPYLAVRSLQQCARDHEHQFPLGASRILNDFYVDDFVSGSGSVEEAVELYRQSRELLASGQFELTKWCSNDPTVNTVMNATPQAVEFKEIDEKSVLGLHWQPQPDVLAFKSSNFQLTGTLTKRKMLSQIGRLYDPNGYIAPVVIKGKILIQAIWKLSLDWDDPVPQPLTETWEEFTSALSDLHLIKIPRWLGTGEGRETELHGFCDASEIAYAAVVFTRTITETGGICVNLVQSKTKVAPLKKITVPRLELCGAHLLIKLMKQIANSIHLPISDTYLWTDSQITLHWINKSPGEMKTFVANRIAHIQHESGQLGATWGWVPGPENPADVASRGTTTQALKEDSLWWEGPKWLKDEKSNWPQNDIILRKLCQSGQEEEKLVHIVIKGPGEQLLRGPWFGHKNRTNVTQLMKTYSNFQTLLRVFATVKRAVHNFKGKLGGSELQQIHGPLTKVELEEAKLSLCRIDQGNFFKKEIEHYSQQYDYKPVVGQDHSIWFDQKSRLLRLFGRVISPNLTFNEQFPILLAPNGDLAKIILREIHETTLHGGVQLMLQVLRQQYWIFRGRRLATSIVHACVNCFKHRMKTAQQVMSALPHSRTTPDRPFRKCGVDYFGPVGLASRTGRGATITKAYGCLFICFTTRAIHLELVSDASTNQFLMALRRMIARRGQVAEIWSDNGTNFVGANTFLQKIYQKQQEWATGLVAQKCRINWHFLPPSSPSWGGLWEAGVKSVKKHLTRVIGTHNLTFEEYGTLLTQVEACVNSRPIAPLSDNPDDLNALTPGHFLVGESLITLQEHHQLNDAQPAYLKRWELVQQMYQSLWRRWHDEYIASIMTRSKWKIVHRNFQTNDLVIIQENNLPPSQWQMGRIMEIIPSKDGMVRAVRVKTPHGEYVRPIVKLALLLPSAENSEEPTSN